MFKMCKLESRVKNIEKKITDMWRKITIAQRKPRYYGEEIFVEVKSVHKNMRKIKTLKWKISKFRKLVYWPFKKIQWSNIRAKIVISIKIYIEFKG